ncbi:unnamed protein product, partial [Laminaria digitata]
VVLIGADLPNEDRHRTPFAALMGNEAGSLPGIVVHAFAVAQLIDGTTFQRQNVFLDAIVAILVAALGVWLAVLRIGLVGKLLLAPLCVFAIWAGGFGTFALAGVMLPIFAPTLAFITAIGLSTALVSHYERQKKQFAEAMVRRRNASLHKLVENSFDGIVVATSDGEITTTNSSADIIMGWQPENIIGTSITEYIPDVDEHSADFIELDRRRGNI